MEQPHLLGPGSPEPTEPDRVEALLRLVPHVVFAPELEPCIPASAQSARATPEAVAAVFDPPAVAALLEGIAGLEARARETDDGGLAFLARTFRHFLVAQKLPPQDHPLCVALYLCAAARCGHLPNRPEAIARALDDRG